MNFTFITMASSYVDSINRRIASSETSASTPRIAKDRGIYFDGVDDSIIVGVNVLGTSDPNDYHALFYVDFSLSIWFRTLNAVDYTSIVSK
jgi:hypothetical protein